MRLRISTMLAIICGYSVLADGFPTKASPGFEVFRDRCMAWHFEIGKGIQAMNAPTIAGLPIWYGIYQLLIGNSIVPIRFGGQGLKENTIAFI